MSRDGPRDPPTANSFSNVRARCQKELCLMSIICKSDDLCVLSVDANLGGSIRLEKEIILDYWYLFVVKRRNTLSLHQRR